MDEIVKPLDEWVFGPKNSFFAVLYADGDVLVYQWEPAKHILGDCVAAYRWVQGRLIHAIGARDSRISAVLAVTVPVRLVKSGIMPR